jgi:hypothetical protein
MTDEMPELVQRALEARGIDDEVIAAGEFNPRGHSGAMFAGGLAGGEVGEKLGGLGEGVGVATGSLAGMHASDAASGLPEKMLIGVSPTTVYGFAERTRHEEPTELVFRISRADLTVSVHKRVNVRVLELIHGSSDSRIELEGNRLPVTHSRDVIEALGG